MAQRYVDEYLAPVWGVRATLVAAPKPNPAFWNMVLIGRMADVQPNGGLAFHDFTGKLPFALVAVTDTLEDKAVGHVMPAFTHELAEMLVNPGCGYWADVETTHQDLNARSLQQYALEVADPVEHTWFPVDGGLCSNFVYPAFFEPWRDGPRDQMGLLPEGQLLLPGGYQIIRDVGDARTGATYAVRGASAAAKLCDRAGKLLR